MFKLEFETDNAAFEDWPANECARILEDVIRLINEGHTDGNIFDYNGNRIGKWSMFS